MKIKTSQFAAALAIAAFIVWAVTARTETALAEAPQASEPPPQNTLPRVETRLSSTQAYDRRSTLQGQIKPWRSVQLRARVAGTVEALLVEQGDRLIAGQPLLSLSHQDYRAQLSSAEASVRLKEAELKAAKQLRRTNLQTETAVLRLQSELEAARSNRIMARQQLDYAQPEAPFAGSLDLLNAELGQYITPGEVLGRIVATNKLKVTAQVPQQNAMLIETGQPVDVILLDGRQLQGEVSFIARAADEATRSFPLEVAVDNPEQLRIAGASATLNIHLGTTPAHRISPALLSLNEQGELGVKWVNPEDEVVFQPVELLSTDTDGAWVSGLPDQVPVITLGGGFVKHGQKVSVTEVAADQAVTVSEAR